MLQVLPVCPDKLAKKVIAARQVQREPKVRKVPWVRLVSQGPMVSLVFRVKQATMDDQEPEVNREHVDQLGQLVSMVVLENEV